MAMVKGQHIYHQKDHVSIFATFKPEDKTKYADGWRLPRFLCALVSFIGPKRQKPPILSAPFSEPPFYQKQ